MGERGRKERGGECWGGGEGEGDVEDDGVKLKSLLVTSFNETIFLDLPILKNDKTKAKKQDD